MIKVVVWLSIPPKEMQFLLTDMPDREGPLDLNEKHKKKRLSQLNLTTVQTVIIQSRTVQAIAMLFKSCGGRL